MQLPRDVGIGHDVLGQIPALCEDLTLGHSALLISGKSTMGLAGDAVLAHLAATCKVNTFVSEEISLSVINSRILPLPVK
ncbi:MAG: hypothetical protein NTV84_00365 [Methanoregula sp.]|nr:hypothetical protein [Methanoregula sp.]